MRKFSLAMLTEPGGFFTPSEEAESITAQIKKQYTEWPYPDPISDLDAWKAHGGYALFDSQHDHVLVFPERAYNPKMSILVVGCGTTEAAVEAYKNPEASVTGIDLSPSSLKCAEKLKKKHRLNNLDLIEMDLHDAASLNRKYDLIVAFGVLHHVEYPHKGLMALSEVLKDDGALFLTLYGKYSRAGIYMVQEALQRLNTSQSATDVSFASEVVDALPPWHPAQAYFQSIENRQSKAAIVDTFLNKRDLSFSVPEIMELVKNSGLEFQGWFDNIHYYPEGTIDPETELYSRLASLPEQEQWALVELLTSRLRDHAFVLRKKNIALRSLRSDLNLHSFSGLFPVRRSSLRVIEIKEDSVGLSRAGHSLRLDGFEREVFMHCDGSASIEDIMANSNCKTGKAEEKTLHFIRLMWRLGHINLSRVPCN